MEDKNKKPAGNTANQKKSYEELNRIAADLYQQNQNLVTRIHQMEEALNDAEFNKMSFLISMLFKVIDHREAYSSDFVVWCIETIENSLVAFGESATAAEEPAEKPANEA